MMPPDPRALVPFPPFTYPELVQREAEARQLKVHTMQQFLRRAAALVDYLDDVTLPLPVIGELVDLFAASPILLAGLFGAGEQLLRRNGRGAVVEIVGSLVEAVVTAIPGLEVLDIATGLGQRKRTATIAREFVEQRFASTTPQSGWWTTTSENQAYYIEPAGDGYIVNHHDRADNVSPTPLMRLWYAQDGSLAIWTPDTNQWTPVWTEAGQPTTRLP